MSTANNNKDIGVSEIPAKILDNKCSDDESDSDSDKDYQPKIDVKDLMKNPAMVAQLQEQMNSYVGANSGYIDSLPAEVKRRLKALKKNQFEIFNVEADFYQKVREIEYEYQKKYDIFYKKRGDIINGKLEPSESDCEWDSDEEEDEPSSIQEIKNDEEGKKDESKEKLVGIPEFWLTTFKNIEFLNDMIQDNDMEVMKHLVDIQCDLHKLPKNGFDLLFKFSKNDYFKNDTLKKTYCLRIGPVKSQGYSYEGPEIVSTTGCKIDWYPNKDITKKVVSKNIKDKSTGTKKTIKKLMDTDSFFNFFDPPTIDDSKKTDDEIEGLLGADFEIGHFISERLIQRAVLYFTGDAISDEEDTEDEGDYDEDEEDGDDDYEDEGPTNQDNCKQQ